MAKESKSTAESPSIKKNDNVLPKKDRPSLVNTLLTYFLLVGVGAIVGYIIFYSIYNHRCSDMMDEAERRFNQTKEELNFKLIEAMYKGTTSEGAESELLELRGRLEGQTGLLGKHQALLDKHQQTVEQLSQMQTTLDRVKMRKSELSKELEISEKKLAEKEEDLNKISMQKDTLEQRLKQTTSKMEELQTQADEAGNSAACQAQKERSLSHIEKLHSSICTEKYVTSVARNGHELS